jgi:single-stranded-DNA-specific exonuclease
MAAAGLAAVSWSALGAEPSLAEPYTHLLALDPPPVDAGLALLTRAPGAGPVHLAWGAAECEFALAYWREQLALRPALAELWRALDGGPLEGEALERALRGAGAHPRGGALAGRLLRVLSELGLADLDLDLDSRVCRARPGARTDLDRSPSSRAYAARLALAERFLAAAAGVRTPDAEARAS